MAVSRVRNAGDTDGHTSELKSRSCVYTYVRHLRIAAAGLCARGAYGTISKLSIINCKGKSNFQFIRVQVFLKYKIYYSLNALARDERTARVSKKRPVPGA